MKNYRPMKMKKNISSIRAMIDKKRLFRNGGDDRDRTCDLLHAMQTLSQLSYTPKVLDRPNIGIKGWNVKKTSQKKSQ